MEQVFSYIISLGASVMMPILFTIKRTAKVGGQQSRHNAQADKTDAHIKTTLE